MNDHQPTINLGPIIFIGLLLFGFWYDGSLGEFMSREEQTIIGTTEMVRAGSVYERLGPEAYREVYAATEDSKVQITMEQEA